MWWSPGRVYSFVPLTIRQPGAKMGPLLPGNPIGAPPQPSSSRRSRMMMMMMLQHQQRQIDEMRRDSDDDLSRLQFLHRYFIMLFLKKPSWFDLWKISMKILITFRIFACFFYNKTEFIYNTNNNLLFFSYEYFKPLIQNWLLQQEVSTLLLFFVFGRRKIIQQSKIGKRKRA